MNVYKRHPWKLIPPIIIMIIIFVHSSMDGDMSTLESDTLIRILGIPLTDTVVVVVRKCAHLTEYAVLGASMYLVTEDFTEEEAKTCFSPVILIYLTENLRGSRC